MDAPDDQRSRVIEILKFSAKLLTRIASRRWTFAKLASQPCNIGDHVRGVKSVIVIGISS
jgi:hypothetical protein